MKMVKGGHLSISVIFYTILMGFTQVFALQQQIQEYVYNNNGFGAYSFEFETADGTYRKEDGGFLSHPQSDSFVVRGEYGYFDSLGRKYTVKYIADSNGFQPQHLGRYNELKSYFRNPMGDTNSHFEEFACYEEGTKKICKLDRDRYTAAEASYYDSSIAKSHVDPRRVYCLMLICFTENELDRVVGSFGLLSSQTSNLHTL